MSVDAKTRNRRALGLALAKWSSALTLIPAAAILFGWLQKPSPLIAEASRWVYAPSAGLMIALAVVGWFMAGASMRKARPRQSSTARVSLALALGAYLSIALTAMQAGVLGVHFTNASGQELSELQVHVAGEEFRYRNLAQDREVVWLVLDEAEELDVEVLASTTTGQRYEAQRRNVPRHGRQLEITCLPELDVRIETRARP